MDHKTVLLQEAVDGLALSRESVVFDATLGSGGHAKKILQVLNATGTYIGVDADETAFAVQKKELLGEANIHLVNKNFSAVKDIIGALDIANVDAILADLGWRMEQFSGNGKGFSFLHNEPLLMTYGVPDTYLFTAKDLVNEWEENSIADVIFGYGEERFARKIAKAIVEERKIKPIQTTFDLAGIIFQAIPKRFHPKRIHPATKTFQALRIAVNDELGTLETLLKDGFDCLAPNGRMAIITFHSLEDRVVKHYFRLLFESGRGTRITKKPMLPSPEEIKQNPRSRSAKLRIIEKI